MATNAIPLVAFALAKPPLAKIIEVEFAII